MLTDSAAPASGDAQAGARERLQLGPSPDWVAPCPFRTDFKPKRGGHLTYLLSARQIHAELRQTHTHVALRLETMQAVQKESQWRLDFHPRTERLTLHWVKTHRGGVEVNHAALEKIRLAPRDGEGAIFHDLFTLVLMLEDVRPGDILEWSYTVERHSELLPDGCAAMYALPVGAPVGNFYFSLRFAESRPMKWISSLEDWDPVEQQEGGLMTWVWTQENYSGARPESDTPAWYMASPWIQISDCPDWEMVASAFAASWQTETPDAAVEVVAKEIAAAGGNLLQQTERAIQLVQDEYRYLAVDGLLDGEPPASAALVARRRFGNAKDLSCLLAHLLKSLGVPSRVVLVNTTLRQSLLELLPAPDLFNHVLVEYEARGETHWVDATLKGQGGGLFHRVTEDYGAGLPIATGSDLVEPPDDQARSSVYELKESILLDADGEWSWLGVVVAARGRQAEALRQELESEGVDAVAAKRLRACTERFGEARRMSAMEIRDDRAANEFFLAEIFEINDFLVSDVKSSWYKLEIANEFTANLLKIPDAGTRRSPFALPYPCNVVHTVEVHAVSLAPAIVQQRDIETPYVRFNRSRKTLAGYWTVKTTLSMLADSVPAEDVEEHRDTVRDIRAQTAWSLTVPMGDPRPHQRSNFGRLPTGWEPPKLPSARRGTRPSVGERPRTVTSAVSGARDKIPETIPGAPKLKRRKRQRRKKQRVDKKRLIWQTALGLVLIAVVVLVLVALARHSANFLRPLNPDDPDSPVPPSTTQNP